MEKEEKDFRAHVVVFPFPAQGHINPMLQFSKRLAYKGLKVTLATTLYITKSAQPKAGSVIIEPFSDGFDEGGIEQAGSVDAYIECLQTIGSRNLAALIEKHNSSKYPVKCLIYDSIVPWALDIAKRLGLIGASFSTHPCAVNAIYYYVHRKLIGTPVQGQTVSMPGLPLLQTRDLPSFVYDMGSYPSMLHLVLNQFSNVDEADWFLINSFQKLEDEEIRQTPVGELLLV